MWTGHDSKLHIVGFEIHDSCHLPITMLKPRGRTVVKTTEKQDEKSQTKTRRLSNAFPVSSIDLDN